MNDTYNVKTNLDTWLNALKESSLKKVTEDLCNEMSNYEKKNNFKAIKDIFPKIEAIKPFSDTSYNSLKIHFDSIFRILIDKISYFIEADSLINSSGSSAPAPSNAELSQTIAPKDFIEQAKTAFAIEDTVKRRVQLRELMNKITSRSKADHKNFAQAVKSEITCIMSHPNPFESPMSYTILAGIYKNFTDTTTKISDSSKVLIDWLHN